MSENHQATDTREIFIWFGRGNDTTRLTAVIAARAITEIFSEEGRLVRLQDGRFVPITKEGMQEIVTRHIKTVRPVNRGTTDEPRWEIEYAPLEFPLAGSKYDLRGPNEKTLIDLIDALVALVARVPRRPPEFKPRQLQEIRTRLKSGEPAYIIARSYGVELDVIQEMERSRWS
jgi:hypothetical protein